MDSIVDFFLFLGVIWIWIVNYYCAACFKSDMQGCV